MSTRQKENSLTPRQERFVGEYMIDMNGTQAVIRAGYSKSGARVTASYLLRLPKVARAIEAAKQARSKAVGIDAEFVLLKLKEILDRTMAEIVPALDRRGKPMRDGEGNPVYKFDAANALRSLELLGKHVQINAFQERVEVNAAADVIAALNAGRRRAAGIVIDAEPATAADPDNGVVAALAAGRRRTALPKPDEDEK